MKDHLREKFPVAAAGWIGVALMELRKPEQHPRGEVFRSFIIATAIMMMDAEGGEHIANFARSEEMAKLIKRGKDRSDDKKKVEMMITRTASVVNKHANENWRMGPSGRRINHFMGVLRILKTKNDKNSLNSLPLRLVAAVGMTVSSGVQWDPPCQKDTPAPREGVSLALVNHITTMVRTSTMHYTYKDCEFYQMDREYSHRAKRLLQITCQWGGGVPAGDLKYLEMTKFQLMAPVLNPLMRLRFEKVRLKKLFKKAGVSCRETPSDIMPSASEYPFNDFDGTVTSPDSDSGSSTDSEEEQTPAKKKRKKTEPKECEKKKKIEERKALEKRKKTEPEECEKKKKIEERKALETKLNDEKRAAAEKEMRDAEMEKKRREEEASKAAESEIYNAARRVRQRTRDEELDHDRRRKEKEAEDGEDVEPLLPVDQHGVTELQPLRALKEVSKKKKSADHYPINTAEEVQEAWGYPKIREAQRKDRNTCQRDPGTCMGAFYNRRSKKVEACRYSHPWIAGLKNNV